MNVPLQTLVRKERDPAAASALGEARARVDRAAIRLPLPLGGAKGAIVCDPPDLTVLEQLDSWMEDGFNTVHMAAECEQVSLGGAAYVVAIDRVARACRDRRWI